MATISDRLSESLSEYLILTDNVRTRGENVNLRTIIGNPDKDQKLIKLEYPYATARMQCIVGPEMAVTAGRNGILTLVPRSLRDTDRMAIVEANNNARLKEGDIQFQEHPQHLDPESKLEDAVAMAEQTGYSVIPVFDRYSELHGFYVHNPDHSPTVPPGTNILDKRILIPLRTRGKTDGIPYSESDNIEEVKALLKGEKRKFVPIVKIDDSGRIILQKLAFLQRFDTNYIGMSINTSNYKKEIDKWGPYVDTLLTDSSNAAYDDAFAALDYAKKRFPHLPFGIGNLIRGKHVVQFGEAGADYTLGGMGAGSICQTGSKRGNGRGQFTVMREFKEARDYLLLEKKIRMQFALDGGISDLLMMNVALADSDFIVMGGYFNRFKEAAAHKFEDADRKISTTDEAKMKYVETWGEGAAKALLVGMLGVDYIKELKKGNEADMKRVLERYGTGGLGAATIEGVEGSVKFRGRMKPAIENDARYIRATISNAGASTLLEYQDMCVLEKASEETRRLMRPHDIFM